MPRVQVVVLGYIVAAGSKSAQIKYIE